MKRLSPPGARRRSGRLVTALAVLVVLPACSFGGPAEPAPSATGDVLAPTPGPGQLGGTVTDEAGRPVFGARVSLGDLAAVADAEGRFVVDRPAQDGLLTVATEGGYGYTPVDAQGAGGLEVTVHPVPGTASTLRTGGEVRTGRALLPRDAGVEAYVEALAGVAPLLDLADAAAVTLATPLLRDPWQRQVDASSTQLADALADSGVDVVNLATDRIDDAGGGAVATTLSAVDSAGLVATGAGADLDAAWLPAVLATGDGQVAYLGCQVGPDDASWAATADSPGAAPCSAERLGEEVARAAADSDAVVVFVREEQQGDQSQQSQRTDPAQVQAPGPVADLASAAAEAGATVVVGAGGHVLGPLDEVGDGVPFQRVGDLLSDDLSWSARDGVLLRTDVAGGGVVSIGEEPLTREQGVPSLVRGRLAGEISRLVAATPDGPLVLAADVAVSGADGWTVDQTTAPARVDEDGAPLTLDQRWWLPPAGQPGVTVGYDLTPTGTFEDVDADPGTDGALGFFLSPGAGLVRDDASESLVCEGEQAVRLDAAERQASLFSAGRVPLPAVAGLSVSASVRDLGPATLTGRLSLEWFAGSSKVGEDSVDLEGLDTSCGSLRLDTVPPADADAVRPLLVVETGDVVVDDLHVVAWAPGQEGGRRYSRVRVFEPVQVTLVADVPRGAATPAGPYRSEEPDEQD